MATPIDLDLMRSRIRYLQPMIDSGHRHVIWYGGDVLSLEHDGHVLTLCANGDVITEYQSDPDDKAVVSVKDKSNHGIFREKMSSCIADDEELLELSRRDPSPNRAWLEIIDNNWWEVFVTKDGTETTGIVLDSENYDEALSEMLEMADYLVKSDN